MEAGEDNKSVCVDAEKKIDEILDESIEKINCMQVCC